MKARLIAVVRLILDTTYFPRYAEGTDWRTVKKYKEAMEEGAKFPPIYVVVDADGRMFVIDGWHRVQAAIKASRTTILAIVDRRLPKREWLAKGYELNAKHGRALTPQDKAMAVNRLKAAGYDITAVAKLLDISVARLSEWVLARTVKGKDGQYHVLKSGLTDQAGTSNQQNAIDQGGPIANASIRRTLDEMLAYLKAGTVDVSVEPVRERVVDIHGRLSELLGLTKCRRKA